MSKILKSIEKEFTIPLTPHDYQVDALKEAANLDAVLLRHPVGLGKSLISLMISLHHVVTAGVEQIIVLCPPVLIDQAEEVFQAVPEIPEVLVYRGTPAERQRMEIESASVVIMSYNIFRGKKDFPRIKKMLTGRKACIIADELSCKSLRSQTFKKLKLVMYGRMRVRAEDSALHKLVALNATPLSDPGQTYNWCALFSPGVYASKRMFDAAHVAREDHWGNVIEWRNLDTLKTNMEAFSINTSKTIALPPLTTTVIPISLSKKHMKLYKEVEQSELSNLPDDKIDLALRSMFSTLQRLTVLPTEFGLDETSVILDFVDSYVSQLNDEGVIIFTRHKAVSRLLHERLPGSQAVYGAISKAAKAKAINDVKLGKCKILIANMDSSGHGLNLQALNHTLHVELPFRFDRWEQIIGRIHRQGQQMPCFANIPLAKNTIQEQIYYKLLKNGQLLTHIIKCKKDAQDFLLDSVK